MLKVSLKCVVMAVLGGSVIMNLSVAAPMLTQPDYTVSDILMQDQKVAPIANQAVSPEQSKQFLLQRFQKNGNFSDIDLYLDALHHELPDDLTATYLYAMRLSLQGDVTTAAKLLDKVPINPQQDFYYELSLSVLYKQRGEFKQALEHLDKAQKKNAKHPYLALLAGNIAFMQQQYAKAEQYYKQALSLSPELKAAQINQANVYLAQNKLAQAEQIFKDVLKKDARQCDALIGLSSVAQLSGRLLEAQQALESCLVYFPHPTAQLRLAQLNYVLFNDEKTQQLLQVLQPTHAESVKVLQGSLAMRQAKYADAIAQWDTLQDKNDTVHYYLALAYLAQNQTSAAATHIQALSTQSANAVILLRSISALLKEQTDSALQILLTDPPEHSLNQLMLALLTHNPEYWLRSSDVLNGFVTNTIDFTKVTKLEPKQVAQLSLAILMYQETFDQAVLQTLSDAPESSFLASYLKGLILFRQKQAQPSLQAMQATLASQPDFIPALMMAAELSYRFNKIDTAIGYFEKIVQLNQDVGSTFKLGYLYEQKQDWLNARRYYEQYIQLQPNSFIGYNQLAWMLVKSQQNLDEALTLATKADKLQPDNISVLDTMGWIAHLQKQTKKALSTLEKANQLAQGANGDVLYHLAVVQVAMNNPTAAKKLLEQANTLVQPFESRTEALKLLNQLSQ